MTENELGNIMRLFDQGQHLENLAMTKNTSKVNTINDVSYDQSSSEIIEELNDSFMSNLCLFEKNKK